MPVSAGLRGPEQQLEELSAFQIEISFMDKLIFVPFSQTTRHLDIKQTGIQKIATRPGSTTRCKPSITKGTIS